MDPTPGSVGVGGGNVQPPAGGAHPALANSAGSGGVRAAAVEPFGPSPILAMSNGAERVRGGSRYSGGASRAGSFGPRPT
ncbi:MAG: hypothetical protein WBV74_03625, partial [Pseudonocardiaceae bacterium]